MKMDSQSRVSIPAELFGLAGLKKGMETYICIHSSRPAIFFLQSEEIPTEVKIISIRKSDEKCRFQLSKEVRSFLNISESDNLIPYVRNLTLFLEKEKG